MGLLAFAFQTAARSPFLDFALALAIGGLVGIEREQKKRAGGLATGGLRTFILIAEAGAIGAWLARELSSPWILAAAGLMVAAVIVAGYWIEAHQRPDALGMTTEVAAMVVFLLGAGVVLGEQRLAVALAIATSAVLAFKEPLHGAVARIGGDDLRAGLKLLIATFIVLPVLPREAVDPWGVLEPYSMWWLVILISGMSLVGYVATRWLGAQRGLALTALAGGLVSSTAVTLGFARKSREGEARAPAEAVAAGVLLAWSVMFARVVVAAAAVDRALVPRLFVPMAAMGAAALIGALVLLRRRPAAGVVAPEVNLKNPFRLLYSVRFALFFAAVQLVVELVRRQWSGPGLYAVAALAGLTDVDAITLSMAELSRAGGEAEARLAVTAILIAVASNTLAKLGLVVVLGTSGLTARVWPATLVVLGSGALALFLLGAPGSSPARGSPRSCGAPGTLRSGVALVGGEPGWSPAGPGAGLEPGEPRARLEPGVPRNSARYGVSWGGTTRPAMRRGRPRSRSASTRRSPCSSSPRRWWRP